MHSNTFVSIIIPAFNEERNIEKCLLSLINSNGSTDQYEIIVVDNGSSDRTRDIAARYAKVLMLPNVNIAALRNYGVKFAKGDILAFLDADCVVEKDWIQNALDSFKSEEIAVAGSPHIVPKDASWVAKAWGINNLEKDNMCLTNYIPSGNLFIKKECFLKIGGFNENIAVSEDTDLCARLKKNNYKILSNKNISAKHLGVSENLIDFFKKELWHGKDVMKIFLHSDFKKQYLKVISYALFYLFIIFAIIISGMFLQYKWAMISVFLALFLPFILSLKTSYDKKTSKYIFGLWILYIVYGIARSVCIIDIRNWIFVQNERK